MPRFLDLPRGPERANSGLSQLDLLIEGGFPLRRAVVACGPPGSGKTTLGVQFLLAGLERGEPGVLVAVDEKPRHLLGDVRTLGWDLEDPMRHGRLALLDASPFFAATRSRGGSQLGARQVAADLAREARRIDARRLVLDTVTSLVPPDLTPRQTDDYLRALIQSLEDNLECTILLLCRASRGDAQQSCRAIGYLAAGIIELGVRQGRMGLRRTLRVRKMRGTRVEPGEYPFSIEPRVGLAIRSAAPPPLMAQTAAATG